MSSDNAAIKGDLLSDGLKLSDQENPSDQSPLTFNEDSDESVSQEEAMDERQSFVKDFMEQKKDSAF